MKVSAIRSGDIRHITGKMPVSNTYTDSEGRSNSYTTWHSFTGTEESELARELQPPAPPIKDRHRGRGILILILNVYPVGTILVGMFVAAINYLVYFPPSRWSIDKLTLDSLSYVMFSWIIPGVATFAAGIAFTILSLRKRSKWRRDDAAAYLIETPKWQRAIARWNLLYYCKRDDVVFIPGESERAPPTRDRVFALLFGSES